MIKNTQKKEEFLIYREVINNALPMVFFTHHFKQLNKVGTSSIRYINKNLLKLIGLTDKEIEGLVGKTFKNMMEQLVGSPEIVDTYFSNLSENRKVEGMELLLSGRNGKKFAMQANSQCIQAGDDWYAQGIFTDKTPEKKLEKQVKSSQKKIKALQTELDKIHYSEEIVFSSLEMQKIMDLVANVADLSTTILIQGETGTGKELIAKMIHRKSNRADKPFFAVNCGALPENLLESELFGHVKGSFTGAVADRSGYFEAANGGTLFLDEIGELSPSLQVKLLRVLEDQIIRPVGSNHSTSVNVRILAATHRNLLEEIEKKNFRDDLYYRLAVLPINLPPLRRRLDDILPLANYFLTLFKKRVGSSAKGFSPTAADKLLEYSWPGNARELQNLIERALILCKEDFIQPSHLLFDIDHSKVKPEEFQSNNPFEQSSLKNLEFDKIQRMLKECRGNRSKAAKKLGISRSTLWRKLQQVEAF